MVRSPFQSNDQSGTYAFSSGCKTRPFIHKVKKMSQPKISIKITDHVYLRQCHLLHNLRLLQEVVSEYESDLRSNEHYLSSSEYNGETGRRLGDRFREHLRDVERHDNNTSKSVARHFNLPNHSKKHMTVSGLSLNLSGSESRNILERKFIFLNPHGIKKHFSFNQFILVFLSTMFPPMA